LCLLLLVRTSSALIAGAGDQVPFTVALFVLPLLYAYPGTGRLLARYRWQILAVQGVLSWVPFAIFGGTWNVGVGGLLPGLVLLTVASPLSWLLAGGLLAAEVVVRATLTGLPVAPTWYAILYVVTYYIDDCLLFFGLVRLAQLVRELDHARDQAAGLAVAAERLQAAEALQVAIGRCLADVARMVAAARLALRDDLEVARGQVAAAGVTAREAVAQARAVTAGRRSPPPESGAAPARGAVIGARLAQAVLVVVLSCYAVENLGYVLISRDGSRLTALAAGDIALAMGLQLYHSRAARDGGRPQAWPLTLGLQAGLVYAFLLPFVAAYVGDLAGFLAGSVLLLVPRWWRWAGYAAVVASSSALYAWLPWAGFPVPTGQRVPSMFQFAAETAGIGLTVYGLSRLAGTARRLDALRGGMARLAVIQERVRIARDVHDLLGLGLTAVALKADLIGRLIGRDNVRASAEIEEIGRICAVAKTDIRLVTGDGQRLSLDGELAAARRILASAGVDVRGSIHTRPLPMAADDVLAPVLREAVTNILRHSAATVCTIEVTADDGVLRLRVSNDGAHQLQSARRPTAGGHPGSGLTNLTARAQAAGGRLTSCQADGRFDLIAEIPLSAPPG
jgi:two-component system sensor histidine kinase DesK